MRVPASAYKAIAVVALVAAAVSTGQAKVRKHIVTGPGPYDGLWSVSIRTHDGPCDASYRYPARIVDGQIQTASGDFSYRISGTVSHRGVIEVTVSKGLGSATGYGRLHGAMGGGRWSTGGSGCSGTWSALRRGV